MHAEVIHRLITKDIPTGLLISFVFAEDLSGDYRHPSAVPSCFRLAAKTPPPPVAARRASLPS
jgi:hypothetical protein